MLLQVLYCRIVYWPMAVLTLNRKQGCCLVSRRQRDILSSSMCIFTVNPESITFNVHVQVVGSL